MKKQIATALCALTLGFAPLAAQAQMDDANTCGITQDLLLDVVTMMLGPWQVSHQSGYVVVQGMTMPFPRAAQEDTVTLERVGNDLIATHPEMQAPMVFKLNDEAPWTFLESDNQRGVPVPTMSSEDLTALYDCEIKDMPRLIGTTTAVIEGGVMDFTWRLMILNTDTMYVVQHITGNMQGFPFFSRRTVLLTR